MCGLSRPALPPGTISGRCSPRLGGERVESVKKHAKSARVREDLQERIRAVGLRSTPTRLALLELLERSAAPVSHGDVYGLLRPRGADRATVFRALADLAGSGLLLRFDAGDHVWRYEIAPSGEKTSAPHPHFLCSDCGAIECLSDDSVRVPRAAPGPRSIIGDVSDVLLRGHCRDCR
jgi:Fur family ferric uptake transcriptional regulator